MHSPSVQRFYNDKRTKKKVVPQLTVMESHAQLVEL